MCARWGAGPRANCSCLSGIDALSPVHVVCVIAARMVVMVPPSGKGPLPDDATGPPRRLRIVAVDRFPVVSACDASVTASLPLPALGGNGSSRMRVRIHRQTDAALAGAA